MESKKYCFFFWERGGVGGQAKADGEGKSINGTGTPESLVHELNWLIGRGEGVLRYGDWLWRKGGG